MAVWKLCGHCDSQSNSCFRERWHLNWTCSTVVHLFHCLKKKHTLWRCSQAQASPCVYCRLQVSLCSIGGCCRGSSSKPWSFSLFIFENVMSKNLRGRAPAGACVKVKHYFLKKCLKLFLFFFCFCAQTVVQRRKNSLRADSFEVLLCQITLLI